MIFCWEACERMALPRLPCRVLSLAPARLIASYCKLTGGVWNYTSDDFGIYWLKMLEGSVAWVIDRMDARDCLYKVFAPRFVRHFYYWRMTAWKFCLVYAPFRFGISQRKIMLKCYARLCMYTLVCKLYTHTHSVQYRSIQHEQHWTTVAYWPAFGSSWTCIYPRSRQSRWSAGRVVSFLEPRPRHIFLALIATVVIYPHPSISFFIVFFCL